MSRVILSRVIPELAEAENPEPMKTRKLEGHDRNRRLIAVASYIMVFTDSGLLASPSPGKTAWVHPRHSGARGARSRNP